MNGHAWAHTEPKLRVTERPEWMAQAACQGMGRAGVDLFCDPDPGPEKTERAYAVCASCVVRSECLEWAMTYREYGIWGGTNDRRRRAIRRQRLRAARVSA